MTRSLQAYAHPRHTRLAAVGRATLLACLLLSAACSQETGKKSETSKRTAKAHLVEVTEVRRENLRYSRVRTGTLRARREVQIFNQEEGAITELPFYEGDRVRQGDLLVRLDDKLLRAQLERAVATRRKAEQDVKRLSKLVKKRLVSDEELASAETALEVARADERVLDTRLGYLTIHAPFGGVVSARLTEPGNVVARHTHLLTVSDPASLVTELTVSELSLPFLARDDAVQAHIDALGDKVFGGRITRIHPGVDPITRRGVVEVELKPVPKGARPGQLCRVTLSTRAARRLVIPFSALRRDEQGEFVYVVDAEGKAQRASVRSGMRLAERVEVIEGLHEGQPLITKGFLGLTPGTAVQPVSGTSTAAPEKSGRQRSEPLQRPPNATS